MASATAPKNAQELRDEADTLKKAREIIERDAMKPSAAATGAVQSVAGGLAATARAEDTYGFRSPREFLGCVLKAYTEPHRPLDKRLAALSANSIRKAQEANGIVTKAAGSDEQAGINDPYGGFLVPPSFSPNLLQIQPEKDPFAGRVTNTPMATPIVNMPARVDKDHTTSVSGGLTVTRRPETISATASRMQFEQVALKAVSLMGIAYATEEILVDSPQSFAAILAKGFSDQFIYHLAKERITGTGVGEFEGILNSPALVTVTAENGQAADTIVYNNIVKMRSRCWGYEQAIWLANHDTYPQLASMSLTVGTGGAAVYQSSLVEGRPDMLNGRPIFYTEYAKKLGDVGDLILGNWGEYLEGTYQPLQNEESVHVRFVNHERAFKFWMRNDGRCWWRSALTTVNSAQTLSPFIVLSAR